MSTCRCLLLSLMLTGFAGCELPDVPPESADRSGDIIGAWSYTQLFIERDKIPTPATAKYPPIRARDVVTDLGAGHYRVKSHVDFQNLQGALIRRHFEAQITKLDMEDHWQLDCFRWLD